MGTTSSHTDGFRRAGDAAGPQSSHSSYNSSRDPGVAAPSSGGSAGGKKFCGECGAKVAGMKFCGECGARI